MTEKRAKKRMFLWVWERAFYDYADGLAVVLAPNAEKARKLLRERIGYDHPDIGNEPKRHGLSKPVAFFKHGGG